MTAATSKDALIAELSAAVSETLDWFEGPGQRSAARIDSWGAWEVLAHFAYWHYATGWGIRSAALGGPPWQLPGSADETNAAALALMVGDGFGPMIAVLRGAHERLLRAARDATDLDATAFRMADGREVSIRERLEIIPRHWRSHLAALRQFDAKS
jgi:hypothetical protein